jgi:DivIVA domain-containing protein
MEDDPEERIAELERQLAGQPADAGAVAHQGQAATGGPLTPEQVRTTAFGAPPTGQRGYNSDEVDNFLDVVEAALREPARRLLTPEQVRNAAFSKPPFGKRGYSENEVDGFLRRLEAQLKAQQGGPAPATESAGPIRYLLYPVGGWDPQIPLRAIDVSGDAMKVIDLKTNSLIASVALSEVTAKPAQHGGIPVMIVSGPGLETMAIRASLRPATWRRRAKSKKPAYLATDEVWLTLAEKFGLGTELVDEFRPQTALDHVIEFFDEFSPRSTTTWRTPLTFGLILAVPSAIYWNPMFLAIGVGLLILAALAWRFNLSI